MYNVADLRNVSIKVSRVRGEEVQAHCPFHEDENPSFSANLRKGVFICFGCGRRGSFSDLGINNGGRKKVDKSAFKLLLNNNKEEEDPSVFGLPKSYQDFHSDFRFASRPYNLYLTSRGISSSAIQKFNIGYCSTGVYQGRIIIPLSLGFVARSIKKKPKKRYLYPLGLPVSELLFNFQRDSSTFFLVEGVFDVIHLFDFGYQATAILGSQLSEEQVKTFCWSKAERIIIAFDGDEAGRRGAESAKRKLERYFSEIRVLSVPENKDPGDLSKKDFMSLYREALTNSKSFFQGYEKLSNKLEDKIPSEN